MVVMKAANLRTEPRRVVMMDSSYRMDSPMAVIEIGRDRKSF